MKYWIDKLVKYFSTPVILGAFFLIAAFYMHLSYMFNPKGIALFITVILLFNVFWVYLIDYYFIVNTKHRNLYIYFFWVSSIALVLWAIFSKMDIDIAFLRDLLVLIISFFPVFLSQDKKISSVLLGYGVITAYFYYVGISYSAFFYLNLGLLLIAGWYASLYYQNDENSLLCAGLSYFSGVGIFTGLFLLSQLLLKIVL